jgi:N-methylhydantoinase A
VHNRVFAVIDRGSNVEAVAWKARMTAIVTKPDLVAITTGDRAEPHAERYAHFHGVGTVMTPCYDGPGLPAGTKIKGPAVIEEPTTTVVVYPGMTATVTSFKNYLIDLGA